MEGNRQVIAAQQQETTNKSVTNKQRWCVGSVCT